jgi:hypothetical protein
MAENFALQLTTFLAAHPGWVSLKRLGRAVPKSPAVQGKYKAFLAHRSELFRVRHDNFGYVRLVSDGNTCVEAYTQAIVLFLKENGPSMLSQVGRSVSHLVRRPDGVISLKKFLWARPSLFKLQHGRGGGKVRLATGDTNMKLSARQLERTAVEQAAKPLTGCDIPTNTMVQALRASPAQASRTAELLAVDPLWKRLSSTAHEKGCVKSNGLLLQLLPSTEEVFSAPTAGGQSGQPDSDWVHLPASPSSTKSCDVAEEDSDGEWRILFGELWSLCL